MDKKQRLLEELERLQKKLSQLKQDWSETKGGSRYGDEYGEVQIKVYENMIGQVKEELKKMK